MAENHFIFGEQSFLVDRRVKEIIIKSEAEATDIEALTSLDELMNKLPNQAMFSARRVFLLEFSLAAKWKGDFTPLEELLNSHTNLLVCYERGKPDRRLQLFKLLAKTCKLGEVASPKGSQLQSWLTSEAKNRGASSFEPRAAAELLALVGNDMALLSMELEKLINFNPKIDLNSVRELVAAQVEGNIFKLVDSVASGRGGEAMILAAELLVSNSTAPYILQMLARQYRLLFRICYNKARGVGSEQISSLLQLHPYAFQNLWRQASGLSADECLKAIQLIAEADYQFKRGSPSPLAMIQTLLVNLAKK